MLTLHGLFYLCELAWALWVATLSLACKLYMVFNKKQETLKLKFVLITRLFYFCEYRLVIFSSSVSIKDKVS